MSTLWKKGWVDTDAEILAFTIGEDQLLDNRIIPFDIIGSLAHARGLQKIGILTKDEMTQLTHALQKAYVNWEDGRFELGPEDEDAHSAIEALLTKQLGETGKKVHAGRSRNDQVLTALRMYMKVSLLDLMGKLSTLARLACDEGANYSRVPMPGYTHMQRAMPSTLAFWYASFAEGWTDSLESGKALFQRLDSSPLGAAAGFGAPIPLDREYTAGLMGFERVQVNAQAVQNSRGRLEAALLGWFLEVGRDVEKMAWDLLLFSSAEFGFVTIPEALCTGSSIMPQKKNADVLELLRATPSVLHACRDEVEQIIAKLPSSYHRDYQLTKPPLMRAVDRTGVMLTILAKALGELKWNKKQMANALTQEIFATHRALELVQQGAPFREAYRTAAMELREEKTEDWSDDPAQSIAALTHLGSPGNPGLVEAKARIQPVENWLAVTEDALKKRWAELL